MSTYRLTGVKPSRPFMIEGPWSELEGGEVEESVLLGRMLTAYQAYCQRFGRWQQRITMELPKVTHGFSEIDQWWRVCGDLDPRVSEQVVDSRMLEILEQMATFMASELGSKVTFITFSDLITALEYESQD